MHTKRLSADIDGIDQAAALLRAGRQVSFATETVYGLGGDATNDRAVAGIFAVKGRPRFNPLIVHLPDVESVQHYVQWSDAAAGLARVFWPGPLTLVLPRRAGGGLSPLVSAGLDTVAIRVPRHPVARSLLRATGRPVAAPSANMSGQISPTTADHVAAGLDGRIAAILDGGTCIVGLESTIIGLVGPATLLRPGGVPQEAIETALGVALAWQDPNAPLSAPGQMTSHYAPRARLRLNATTRRPGELLLGFGPVAADLNLSYAGDLTEAAAQLFGHLHALDARSTAGIAVSPIPETGLGRAINDRLRRAAAPKPG